MYPDCQSNEGKEYKRVDRSIRIVREGLLLAFNQAFEKGEYGLVVWKFLVLVRSTKYKGRP